LSRIIPFKDIYVQQVTSLLVSETNSHYIYMPCLSANTQKIFRF